MLSFATHWQLQEKLHNVNTIAELSLSSRTVARTSKYNLTGGDQVQYKGKTF